MRRPRLVLSRQFTTALPHQSTWWGRGDQRDDGAALGFRQPRLPPGTGAIAQPIEPHSVEADDPLAHRLRMAAQLGGNGDRAHTIPATHDHLRAANPVTRRMATPGELPNLAFLRRILR